MSPADHASGTESMGGGRPAAEPQADTAPPFTLTQPPGAGPFAGQSHAPPAAPGESVAGRYTIVRHLASGGMGVVYVARDAVLGRDVALKQIHPGLVSSAEVVERFRREARAAAGLDHPNIVAVYDTGEHDGRHFFTMALVDGPSLQTRVKDGSPLAAADAVRLLVPISEAVAFAHARNVVHRDLKPDNVLLDAGGRPRVTDFGLARHLSNPGNLTGGGQILGTPRYMAPEQVRNAEGAVGPAADVYALGGILVFVLTGRPPFDGGSLTEILFKVVEEPPLLPRDVRPDVPADLHEVCRRCLAKDPASRYPSADALADALRASVGPAGHPTPTGVNPRSGGGRRGRWLGAAAAALAVVGIGLLASRRPGPSDAPPPNDDPRLVAASPSSHDTPVVPQPPPEVRVPPAAVPPGDATPPRVVEPPVVVTPVPVTPAVGDPERFVLRGHQGGVWNLLAIDGKTLISWGADKTLRTWDATTGKEGKPLSGDPLAVVASAVAADRSVLAVAADDGSARAWAFPSRAETFIHSAVNSPATAVAFAPDGVRVAVGTKDGMVFVYDRVTRRLLAECEGHGRAIVPGGLLFTADGGRLVSGSADESVRVWNPATGKRQTTVLNVPDLWRLFPTHDPDRVLAAVTNFGTKIFKTIDLKTGAVSAASREFWIDDVFVSPDRKVLWEVDGSFDLQAWDLVKVERVVQNDKVRGTRLAFASTPASCLFVIKDLRLHVYRVDGLALDLVRTEQEHTKPIRSLAASPDGAWVATGDEGGVIKVWNAAALARPK